METRSSSHDATLVDGLRAGRSDAFEQLYADYGGPIYNLCARIVCDREEAKDLTQEVFIAAFGRLPEAGSEPLKLRPWLFRVATNACFNHLRSRGRLSGGGDAELESVAAGVNEFDQSQTVAYVEESLGEMNERYRTVLVLKDLQGLPVEEIAAVMEVSRANADVLVYRARSSFKTAFARLAGDRVPAPASLGLVLAPLALPAALQAMPALAGVAVGQAAGHVAGQAAGQVAGHAAGGLLAKISAALTTKVAVGVAAATVVIGGTAVVYEASPNGAWRADATTTRQAAPTAAPSHDATSGTHHSTGDGHWRDHHWTATHGDHHWDPGSGRWVASDGGHSSTHSGSGGGTSSGSDWQSHDSGTSGSSGTYDSGSGTSSDGHDGGDMSGDW